MPENESIQDRLKKFISEKGLTPRGFELEMGFANAYVRNIRKGIGSDKIEEIYKKFPDLDIHWLFTGEKIEYNLSEINEPLSEYSIDNRVDNSVPYWNLPVSAGKSVVDIIGSTKPSGYIYGLPGADLAENILPVDGASMEPEALEIIERRKGFKKFLIYQERYANARNLTKQINKHLKKVGKEIGVPDLKMYHARHSWAGIAARKPIGATKALIGQALGHGRITVTDTYFDYDNELVDDLNRKVLDLLI